MKVTENLIGTKMYNSHKSFGEASSFTNKTIIFSYLLMINASHTIQQRWPHLSPPLQFYLSFSSTLYPSHQAPYPTPSPTHFFVLFQRSLCSVTPNSTKLLLCSF